MAQEFLAVAAPVCLTQWRLLLGLWGTPLVSLRFTSIQVAVGEGSVGTVGSAGGMVLMNHS